MRAKSLQIVHHSRFNEKATEDADADEEKRQGKELGRVVRERNLELMSVSTKESEQVVPNVDVNAYLQSPYYRHVSMSMKRARFGSDNGDRMHAVQKSNPLIGTKIRNKGSDKYVCVYLISAQQY